jgi:hypothetical protein
MKTNPVARRIVRMYVVFIWLAIAVLAGLEFRVGEALAARIGQTCNGQTLGSLVGAPNMGIADLMAAAGR